MNVLETYQYMCITPCNFNVKFYMQLECTEVPLKCCRYMNGTIVMMRCTNKCGIFLIKSR